MIVGRLKRFACDAAFISIKPLLASAVIATSLFNGAAYADPIAYMIDSDRNFGTIDLSTGAFSALGSTSVLLAGLGEANGGLYGVSFNTTTGMVYSVDPNNGALTSIGSNKVDYDTFGSSTAGLFAIDIASNLYGINPVTGAATLIGPTGLSLVGWRALSAGGGTLYFADAEDLYTIDTTTGAAILLGPLGLGEIGAMVDEGGILYAGQAVRTEQLDTLNTTTGAATALAAISGTSGEFFGLAPDPNEVPEPGSIGILSLGIAALTRLRRPMPKRG